MICDQCKDLGIKSNVYEGYSTCTAMYCQPYYDGDGKYHHHDMNSTTTNYSCSNGHTFHKFHKPVWTCCEKPEEKQ